MSSHDFRSDSDMLADIETAAVHWLGRRDSGTMSTVEEAAFVAWLAADARHAAAFAAVDRMWNGFDRLESVRPADGEPDPDLLAPARERVDGRGRPALRWVAPVSLAAAAAIVVLGLTWWELRPLVVLAESAETRVGVQNTMKLPDGSTIQLNTDTAIEVRFDAAERGVRLLRGEAHFTVAKNRARPFVVHVGGAAVRAIGTAFNVRVGTAAVEVLVTEGQVRVDDAAGGSLLPPPATGPEAAAGAVEPLLTAGSRLVLPAPSTAAPAESPSVSPVTPAEIGRVLAWREQRLEFIDSPLAEVVAEFNRYNAHKLVIADARLDGQRFGGKFRPDGCEALVQLLETSFGVQVERREFETVLRLPATAPVASR